MIPDNKGTLFGMPTERRSERRADARRNASQTRPDQTRVVVTAVCGVGSADQIQSHRHLCALAAPIGFGMDVR